MQTGLTFKAKYFMKLMTKRFNNLQSSENPQNLKAKYTSYGSCFTLTLNLILNYVYLCKASVKIPSEKYRIKENKTDIKITLSFLLFFYDKGSMTYIYIHSTVSVMDKLAGWLLLFKENSWR